MLELLTDISAGRDGRLLLWHFGRPNAVAEFSLNPTFVPEAKGHTPPTITRYYSLSCLEFSIRCSSTLTFVLVYVSSVRFNEAGTKLAATTLSGRMSVWPFQYRPAAVDNPVICASENFEVHDKHANDFEFVKVTHIRLPCFHPLICLLSTTRRHRAEAYWQQQVNHMINRM
jgi:hypothetical protein